jgi:ABC-2 type transport system ATP-binding protein
VDIIVEGATYRYRRRGAPVLAGLDLTVPPGRTVLLGPNGAGKSTLLGATASALGLSGGSITVDGLRAGDRRHRSRYRRRIGWMPQAAPVASAVTVREHVALHGWLAGLGRADAWERSLTALRQADLTELGQRRATTLSGGQHARMGLAQALVHGADVLLLDEPAAALDPDQTAAFHELTAELADGRTIVVSTHDVGELATAYDHVVVLDAGQVRFAGSTREFVAGADGPIPPVDAYRRALRDEPC